VSEKLSVVSTNCRTSGKAVLPRRAKTGRTTTGGRNRDDACQPAAAA
jgi:hypothetical protein